MPTAPRRRAGSILENGQNLSVPALRDIMRRNRWSIGSQQGRDYQPRAGIVVAKMPGIITNIGSGGMVKRPERCVF